MPKVDIHETLLRIAKIMSECSYANKKKVGAVLCKDTRIISTGYNGKVQGLSNVCETEDNKTYPEVIHAEMNCILFAAKNGLSTQGTVLYVTCSPCLECAKAIIQSGITEVYYSEKYRCSQGLLLLETCDIKHHYINDFYYI